jgi:hypothetical protein
MTFYQLVLTPRGYALTPYVTIYNNMIEIQLHDSAAKNTARQTSTMKHQT